MALLSGEAVTVIRKVDGPPDPFGEPSTTEEREAVGNVLVQPGPTADLDASRPDGVSVAYTLQIPKSFTASLRGCAGEVRGERFDVVGDPRAWPDDLTPGEWNRTCEVGRVDG